MAGKRAATSDLNHDNWNEEEEHEERGTFPTATQEEISQRLIKKARRKVTSGSVADGNNSIFGKFQGFLNTGANTSNTASASAIVGTSAGSSKFDFLSKIPSVAASAAAVDKPMFNLSSSAPTTSNASAASNDSKTLLPDSSGSSSRSADDVHLEFQARVKSLNISVRDWIVESLKNMPICSLIPIFKDYERFLDTLRKERDEKLAKVTASATASAPTVFGSAAKVSTPFEAGVKSSISSDQFKMVDTKTLTTSAPAVGFHFMATSKDKQDSAADKPTSTAGFSFASSSTTFSAPKAMAASESPAKKTNGFSFGDQAGVSIFKFGNQINVDKKDSTSATPTFSFFSNTAAATDDNKPAASDATTASFSFMPNTTKPFSFGFSKPTEAKASESSAAVTTGEKEEDEEDEPPKVEFKQVVEDDAIYSKRCKVFVKKESSFVDRGVGTLYLKPIKDSEKVQLIVRADTNLGNILVNIILSEAIPAQRTGKNNVMLVCLPTSDVEKPTPTLLRVKTAEEADELYETIQAHKK